MANKNMKVALLISVIFTGLGIAYAGNVKKGAIIFIAKLICNVLSMIFSNIFYYLGILLWIYGLYATYLEVNAVNGGNA